MIMGDFLPSKISRVPSAVFLLEEPPATHELELELIQTHMTQKPVLRVEVGALGARQVKN